MPSDGLRLHNNAVPYAEPAALVLDRIVQLLFLVFAQLQQCGNRTNHLPGFDLNRHKRYDTNVISAIMV